jgi:hypothetical protein
MVMVKQDSLQITIMIVNDDYRTPVGDLTIHQYTAAGEQIKEYVIRDIEVTNEKAK